MLDVTTQSHNVVAALAEAYALVEGTLNSKGGDVTVSK